MIINPRLDTFRNITEPVSFYDFKQNVMTASVLMSKSEILEIADALHDALRARRAAAEILAPAIS